VIGNNRYPVANLLEQLSVAWIGLTETAGMPS
jgi:hypothetical protein